MANRVIIGKNINTNHGHSNASPGYGIYVSRPGKNVESCTADELIMNTDSGQGTSLGRIIGLFQLPAIPLQGGGTATTVSTNVTANTTTTISVANINFGLGLGFFSFGGLAPTSVGSNTTTSAVSFTASTSLNTISIENVSNNNVSIKAFIVPRYSNLAFF